MARYSVEGNHGTGAVNNSSIFVETAAVLRRLKIYDVMVGSSATPADNAAEYSIYRATAGTPAGGTPTAVKLDAADAVATAVPLGALTTEPTSKTSLINFALNMRATYRWVAAPNSELVIAAATAAGCGIEKLVTSASFAFDTVTLWKE